MVQLHVKRGDESQFLFSTTVDVSIETLTQQGQRHLWWKIKSGQDLHWYDNDVILLTFFGFYWFMLFDIRVHTIECMYYSVSGSYSNRDKCKNKCETFNCILLHKNWYHFYLFLHRNSRAGRSWRLSSTEYARPDRWSDHGAQTKGWMGRPLYSQRWCWV